MKVNTTAHDARERLTTWALVVISCGALVATSAPRPAKIQHQSAGSSTGTRGINIHITEEGVDQATSAGINVTITAELTAEELEGSAPPTVAHVSYNRPGLPPSEHTLVVDPKKKQLIGTFSASVFRGCDQAKDNDTACDIQATVRVVPPRPHHLAVSATLTNRSSSLPISNPTLGDGAKILVSVP